MSKRGCWKTLRDPKGLQAFGLDGHISSLYVRSNCVRQGVGKRLLKHLLVRAKERHIPRVYTEASRFSKTLFAYIGFGVVEEEIADYDGVKFLRWKMEKLIG